MNEPIVLSGQRDKTSVYMDVNIAEWLKFESIRRTKAERRQVSVSTLINEALLEYVVRSERKRGG